MKRAVFNTKSRQVEARKAAGRDDTVARMARAMQQSPAWPAVFRAGTAQTLAEAALDAIERRGPQA